MHAQGILVLVVLPGSAVVMITLEFAHISRMHVLTGHPLSSRVSAYSRRHPAEMSGEAVVEALAQPLVGQSGSVVGHVTLLVYLSTCPHGYWWQHLPWVFQASSGLASHHMGGPMHRNCGQAMVSALKHWAPTRTHVPDAPIIAGCEHARPLSQVLPTPGASPDVHVSPSPTTCSDTVVDSAVLAAAETVELLVVHCSDGHMWIRQPSVPLVSLYAYPHPSGGAGSGAVQLRQ